MAKKQLITKKKDFRNPNGERGYVEVSYDKDNSEITCTIVRVVPSVIPDEEIDEALKDLLETGIEGVTLQLSPEEVEKIFNKEKNKK